MKAHIIFLVSSLFLAHTTHALDYEYSIDGGKVTITDYIGSESFITIPDTIEGFPVTTIGSFAFADYTSLQSIVLPSSLTSIDPNAFRNCINLDSVEFPDGLETIAGGFYNCSNLKNVVIPDSVTTLGNYSFKYCSSLTNIVIPSAITSIAPYVFQHCTSLKHLYFKGDPPVIGSSNVFEGVPSDAVVYYIPNRTGWGSTFEGFATELWLPRLEVGNGTGSLCTIVWVKDLVVVVEACESLTAEWQPIQTVTLSEDQTPFTDPEAIIYSTRFYRISWP